jgi:3-oxoacyl-[acyl-carrier-protein] synthase-1
MTRLALEVRGIGAVTPVGLSAPASMTALRAGIARLGPIETHAVEGPGTMTQALIGGRVRLELLDGKPEDEGEDFPGHRAFDAPAPAPLATYVADGPERLAAMAFAALEEALVATGWTDDVASPVTVRLAVDAEDGDPATRALLVDAIGRALAAAGLGAGEVAVEPLGRAGAVALLDRPAARGREGRLVVGGVGSWIRPARAAQLEAHGNLRSEDRPLGIHPGESAAFVALQAAGVAGARGVHVAAAAIAQEAAPPPEKNEARGLSSAMSAALSDAGGEAPRPLVVCDLNGDRYRALEWTMALARVLGGVHEDGDVWHPAEGCGDAGAGLGALCLAVAVDALATGNAGASRVLVWGASQGPLRAAAVLALGEKT